MQYLESCYLKGPEYIKGWFWFISTLGLGLLIKTVLSKWIADIWKQSERWGKKHEPSDDHTGFKQISRLDSLTQEEKTGEDYNYDPNPLL